MNQAFLTLYEASVKSNLFINDYIPMVELTENNKKKEQKHGNKRLRVGH